MRLLLYAQSPKLRASLSNSSPRKAYDRGESTFIVGARSCILSRSQHDDHTIQAPMKPITGPGPHSSGTRVLGTYTLTLMRYQVDVERAGQRPPQRFECPRRRGRLHTPPCEAKASTKKPAQRKQKDINVHNREGGQQENASATHAWRDWRSGWRRWVA